MKISFCLTFFTLLSTQEEKKKEGMFIKEIHSPTPPGTALFKKIKREEGEEYEGTNGQNAILQ